MTETRQDRFKRLAVQRTNIVLEKLRILGNLSNRANYDYSDEEINKIFYAIDSQLKMTKARFIKKKKKEFRL
ncbi:MAG: hypothetical protein A2900_02170 [Candidatus Chisholmbacteria bacterium RIFCSPLOWO2_01_FULL_50_28]|uniref:Uncharacterized protein n=1 Tax=Candidatus Chisholmbacteria bacterium RIFCSPHIGHO2_01_FULL_52_32 TaxID=1797591 RepID=A0A1G1VTK2_9BACT|nr:MAG: hypothetical protein A2786_04575 [Candidatus Chisholmbacteria bacterium RIFCSPHIGHO2_01_FULL_52_32]OGY19889.1 MAG: hypothetical protein A2900_02170 [Candidatus Chisholmbacteria bacterium RIFCSPLOWO2_01_FULL_50_28]